MCVNISIKCQPLDLPTVETRVLLGREGVGGRMRGFKFHFSKFVREIEEGSTRDLKSNTKSRISKFMFDVGSEET